MWRTALYEDIHNAGCFDLCLTENTGFDLRGPSGCVDCRAYFKGLVKRMGAFSSV